MTIGLEGATQSLIERVDFPGKTNERILVIGGVHGAEQAGIEVVRRLIDFLCESLNNGLQPQFGATLVPVLFAANFAKAKEEFARRQKGQNPRKMADSNSGRKTANFADPNRQFPKIGQCLSSSLNKAREHVDSQGRRVEDENVFLMRLISEVKPKRIISVHSKRLPSNRAVQPADRGKLNLPGIFVDPVTDLNVEETRAKPLTSPPKSADDGLALEAAEHIHNTQADLRAFPLILPRFGDLRDDWVIGNWLEHAPTARYANAAATEKGFSLGEWAPRKVKEATCKEEQRQGIPVFTVEVRRYFPSEAYLALYKPGENSTERKSNSEIFFEHQERIFEIDAHARAIKDIFLEK